jgi:hypothetical protein
MAYALVDPGTQVIETPAKKGPPYVPPVYYPNSARVAQVEPDQNSTFPVASPLEWIQCPDGVVADQWYYNTSTLAFVQINATT